MELFLIKLVAVARPLASAKFAEGAFEVIGSGLFGLLIVALLIKGAVQRSLRLSAVDMIIAAFTLWCIAVSIIYFDSARVSELAKLIIPLATYTVAKNVIRNSLEYEAVLGWAIVGFSLPVMLSAVLIAAGSERAVGYVAYWTSLPRWEGVYTGSHNLGHSMTLFVIMLVLYVTMRCSVGTGKVRTTITTENLLMGILGVAAIYSLYMSQVRSAFLGLLTFACIYLYFYNKPVLIIGGIGLAAVAAITAPYWIPALVPEAVMQTRGVEVGALDIGSGRPRFWLNDLRIFYDLPIDRKIAGVGIGAALEYSIGEEIMGHNDWLQMLTQTGVVGFALFATLQVLLFRRILRMPGTERYAFLALFLAVNLMMFVSNSYAWRIQVGHLYYLILAYVELQPRALSVDRKVHSGGAGLDAFEVGLPLRRQ